MVNSLYCSIHLVSCFCGGGSFVFLLLTVSVYFTVLLILQNLKFGLLWRQIVHCIRVFTALGLNLLTNL